MPIIELPATDLIPTAAAARQAGVPLPYLLRLLTDGDMKGVDVGGGRVALLTSQVPALRERYAQYRAQLAAMRARNQANK